MKENCAECKHHDVFWGSSGCNLLNNEDSCKFEPKVMTNADRIRAMSDEELVGFIRVIYMSEECPLGTLECETCFLKESCAGICCGKEIEWLQQPAKEDCHSICVVTNLPCIRCNPGGCENRKEGADNG